VSAAINRLNCAWTLAGVPVLALPCASSGLPVGAQLVGPPSADWQVLDAGAAIQRGSDWHERRPPISAVTTAGAAEPAQAGRSDLSSQ
jgi:Asp-tRNA(Asn)/Glu-tRNA(Gln) amidotransferase A subunit family amidase